VVLGVMGDGDVNIVDELVGEKNWSDTGSCSGNLLGEYRGE
jgi:hypothetical protein